MATAKPTKQSHSKERRRQRCGTMQHVLVPPADSPKQLGPQQTSPRRVPPQRRRRSTRAPCKYLGKKKHSPHNRSQSTLEASPRGSGEDSVQNDNVMVELPTLRFQRIWLSGTGTAQLRAQSVPKLQTAETRSPRRVTSTWCAVRSSSKSSVVQAAWPRVSGTLGSFSSSTISPPKEAGEICSIPAWSRSLRNSSRTPCAAVFGSASRVARSRQPGATMAVFHRFEAQILQTSGVCPAYLATSWRE